MMMKKIRQNMALTMLLCIVMLCSALSAQADATTEVHVVKYAPDGTTILDETTVTTGWMETNLPVHGDGTTHYYHQGPVFDDDADRWDPDETLNLKDKGALKGTDVKDLCDLVGGMSSGDEIKIKAFDGFYKSFAYKDVYTPEAEQGPMVLCWHKDGNSVPAYDDGIQLVFFARTQNAAGQYVFGNWDMHECLDEEYRYNYSAIYPSSNGLSVRTVSDIEIYTTQSSGGDASTSLTAIANVEVIMVGISLNRTEIDYGDVGPGLSSDNEPVEITNIGSSDVDVSLEVEGKSGTAQDFYEQSLFVDNELYNPATTIAQIITSSSEDILTQLRVPSDWNEIGTQDATFVFWAEEA
ncbi:MAG: hypothetical protein HF976_06410 [ANME-2 cluster archaeon]|nr:hypothetical protein [ANME-2 cluster archaeon]MBC2707726.1 hypothetical protein [ANME-2 cluster archaeon]MBC2747388.1 hypothetical protein [ANME-2 cluster archaeon]MBC2762608.1 hypothetical protein [ANME-2 cluster archaeon]